MIIQWTNKLSGEQGFVKCINHKDKYFENTLDRSLAMKVSTKNGSVKRAINALEKYCPSNTYTAITVA